MKFTQLFLLFVCAIFASCSNSNSSSIDDVLTSFYKMNQLDKRTSYLQVNVNSKAIQGKALSSELANQFVSFYNEETGKQLANQIVTITPKIAYVRNSVANARTEGKHSAELSTQYLMGQTLKVLDEQDGWYYIQGSDNYLAWVDKGGVLLENEVSKEWVNNSKQQVEINETVGYFQQNPQQVATDIVFGNLLAQGEGQAYITPAGDHLVFKEANVFTKDQATDSIQIVLDRAKSLLGRPYLWGGTSTKGMDCSGFTRTSFLDAGYLLGRDASLQVHEGKEVDKDNQKEWKPGDLLFFGTIRDDGSQRITHVAIHIENGTIIHSAQRVKIESLNPKDSLFNENRYNSLLRVKRIF